MCASQPCAHLAPAIVVAGRGQPYSGRKRLELSLGRAWRAAGGGDAGMAEDGLDEMNGRPAVESMRSVRVPEPVRREMEFDAGGGLEHRSNWKRKAASLMPDWAVNLRWIR
jgi:hypothetical protein